MTYEEVVEKVRESASKVDASSVKDHIAYQFNIQGEAEGAFYIEVSNGTIDVQPYEYYDRDVIIYSSAATILGIMSGEINPIEAFTNNQIGVEGDLGKAAMLEQVLAK